MDDPFADIPIVGKGQAGSVPTAPSNDIPIGPNGEQLNLPPNTGATNVYGGISAPQTNAESSSSVAEDPFADIPMLGKASASPSATPNQKIELEKDNPFADIPMAGKVPKELPWYENLAKSAAAQTAAGAIQTAGGFERAGAAPVTDISGVNAPFQRGATTQEATSAFDKAIADKQSALDSIQGIVKKQGFSTAEYGNQINDLQREIGDLQAQKEQTLKLPQYASDFQQQELIQQRQQLGKEAGALSEQAAGMFPALGVSQQDTSIAAQLGRGIGGVVDLAPAMATGPLALPTMVVMGGSQAYGEGYDAKVQELKQQGITDQNQLDEAGHQAGSQAAVNQVPALAAYTIGGSLTTAATSALLKGASPLVKGLVGGTAASGVNLGVSGGLRKAEGGNFLPNVEQAVPDIFFGNVVHGLGAGLEARAEAKKAADDQLGGPAPEVAPSSNPLVNEKEAQITTDADSMREVPAPVVETPTPAPAPATTDNTQRLIDFAIQQLEHEEGSDKWNEYQAQIDQLKAGETPAPAEVSVAKIQPSITQEASDLINKLDQSGSTLPSINNNVTRILRENGIEVTDQMTPEEAINALREKSKQPAEKSAQPTTEYAVQEPSAREVGVRNAPAVGEGVGEENKSEVPAQEGQAPKEEVKPTIPTIETNGEGDLFKNDQLPFNLAGEVLPEEPKPLTIGKEEEQQLPMGEVPKPSEPTKPAEPEKPVNPYREVEKKYYTTIKSHSELADEVEKVANKEKNKFLKESVQKYRDALFIGADMEPEVEKLLSDLEREGNYHDQGINPSDRGLPKGQYKKPQFFGGKHGDEIIRYLQENKILSKFFWKKEITDRGESLTGRGSYDGVPEIPKKHSDTLYGKNGKGQKIDDALKGLHEDGKALDLHTPDDLWKYIKEASDFALKEEEETKKQNDAEKRIREASERLKKLESDPEKLADAMNQDLKDYFDARRGGYKGDAAFFEFPDSVKKAVTDFGNAVYKAGMSFGDWSKTMISRIGEGVRDYLRQIWKAAKDYNEKLGRSGGIGRTPGIDEGELRRKAEEAKYGPKPPSEREAYTERLTNQLTNVLGRKPTDQEVSAQVEKKFGKAEAPAPSTESTSSKTTKIVGPSARLMKEAEARGEIIAPPSQEGVSPKERLSRGQNLIARGADPEQVLSNFENTKRFSTDDQDIVDAKAFELSQNAERASRKGINSPEYIAARKAHQEWIDRSQSMSSQAGSALSNLRGGNDIDTGTFYGMQDSFYKRTKKNFTLTQAESAKKLSNEVKSYNEEEQKKQSDLNNALDDALKNVPSEPVASADDAIQKVADAEPGSQAEVNRNASVLESENSRLEKQLEEHKKTISDLQEELKSRPSKIRIISEKASKAIDDLADAAEKRIAARRREGRLFSGVPDPTELADYVAIGARFIKNGALEFGQWTSKMRDKFGEAIEPYLKQIYKQSDDLVKKFEETKASRKTAKQSAIDSLESEIKSAKDSISKIGKPSTEVEAETIARLEKQVKRAQSRLDDINAGKIEDPKKLLGPISERVNDLENQKADIEKKIREIRKKQSEQEKVDISEQNLRNRAKNLEPAGKNITPKQAKIIWDYAKKFYLDKGPIDYTDMVNKVADDLGLTSDSVQRAFASPKIMRSKINKLIDVQYNRDSAVRAAKRWLDEQEKSWGRRYLDKAFSLQTKFKIAGHGSAAAGTHAPSLLFTHPLEWFKTLGDSFKYSFTGEKGRRQNYIDNKDIKSDPNYHTARKYGAEVDPDKKQQGYEHSDSENKIIKALNKYTGGRGYDALFSLRMRMWNSVWEPLSAEEKTPEFGKFLADWVNHQTGFAHGEYILANNLAKYAFFAKPLYKSRWGWLLGDPLTAGKNTAKWVAGKATPAEKLQATIELRTKLKFVAAYATMLGFNQGLLALTGSNQKINWTDWKKGDWLAFKGFGYEGTPMYSMTRLIRLLGNEIHILNPFSKLSPYERAQGERKNVFINNIRDYLAGGWSPGVQNIFSVISGKDYAGNIMPWSSQTPKTGAHKLTPFQAAAGFLLPIPIAEAVSQKRWTEGAVKGIASGLFGIQLRTPEDVERFTHIKSQQNSSTSSGSRGSRSSSGGS